MSVTPVPTPERAPVGARAASAAARVSAVETVIRAMRERLDRPFVLEEMARIAYLSPYYFNRVFRQVTGIPPRRFQTALRMVAAKRLLLTTDLSVTEICLEVGYSSLGTFVTQFRELVGVSPRSLRGLAERPWSLAALPAPAAHHPSDARVAGELAMESATPMLAFVGLFADASPEGIPAACAVLAGNGAIYHIGPVPLGRHHVAAAALPYSADPRGYLLPEDDVVLVGTADRPVIARRGSTAVRHLHLRPKRTTDPPILLAPHALLGAR
jgi:AraC family transcriptional regulator